ncbi:hypothetical protein FB192DRAFT_1000257 [Mucor lusitanicus]|uniref:Uncharacterized protein n=1 Tax=Mucor circinelloides f. lusitanicus TaxID=29924 RepID=A0A8H4F5Y4_MUCCL|nr:hypothetical protein FB192DRAFT_1000257 [Mucor lusitanicus]
MYIHYATERDSSTHPLSNCLTSTAWDITCRHSSPESFAETMATDLGLGGEFKTAITHSIREQVHVFIKSLLLKGYEFGEGPVENDDLRRSFLPAIRNAVRDHCLVERFHTPYCTIVK